MSLDAKSAYGKLTSAFLDSANKKARYNVCIQRLKTLKETVKEVSSGPKAKRKARMMVFHFKMHQNECC